MSEQRRRRRPIVNLEAGDEDEQQRKNLAPNVPRHFDDYSATNPQDALLEYIKTAIEIETDIATQERIISECQKEISRRKPELHLKRIPQRPEYVAENDEALPIGVIRILIVSGIGMTVISLYGLCVGYMSNFWKMKDQAESGLLVALLIGLGLIIAPCMNIHKIEKAKRINAKLDKEYSKKWGVVEYKNTEIKADYDRALHEWEESGSEVVGAIQPHLDETRALLARHYAENLIYPKYQNLPALTSIYEYFITGRCEGLTGPYGAYNLYEDEIRKDTVISQLNRVVENLEQIRQNQYMLYTKVCTIQQEAAAIRNELAQIKGYTIRIADLAALSAYYAKLTERNTRVMMYYHMF